MAQCPAHDDRNPSLSIKQLSDGRILLKCHGGCRTEDILSQLQLTWNDLRGTQASPSSSSSATPQKTYSYQEILSWPWTQAVYDYQDAAGISRYLVVRIQSKERKKSFVQYRALSNGRYQKGLGDAQTFLYRLPDVLKADGNKDWIYLVEGEKDVETLRKLGLVATCNPGGAGKWRSSFDASLQALRLAILPDNDDIGRLHAESVAVSMAGKAKEIRIVELPGLATKGDVTDWMALGHSREDLVDLVDSTPPWIPPRTLSERPVPQSKQFHLTDLGNAQRLVLNHGEELRFCHPWGKWLVWDGRRWASDQTGEVIRKAKSTVRSIYTEAALILDDRQRQATAEHARRSESLARVKAMVSCGESEPGIPILPDQLDADLWLLNCRNGTVDLRTGKLHPHRRENLITQMTATDYEPSAQCPNWERFLETTLAGNQDLIQFLQRAVGYSLTGETREHCLFFLYGTGRNGKSTFLECLYGLLGDYSQKADFSTFLEKKQDSIRNDLARLKGARFLSASEAAEERRFAEALVKDMTGGETITARHLYGEYFDFKPSFKLFLSANHKPSIRGMDEGIWSRIRLIPFTNFIPPDQRDRRLPEKLRQEWPGILSWAVRGCLDWQRYGLSQPAVVEKATREYREEMDPLAGFFQKCTQGPELRITAKALYEAYSAWCLQNEEEAISQKAFGTRLTEKGLTRSRGRHAGAVVWFWSGITVS